MILGSVQAHMLGRANIPDGVFVVVADGNTSPTDNDLSAYSVSGLGWTNSATPPTASESWEDVAYGNYTFVTVSSTGTNRVCRASIPGNIWVPSTTPPSTSYAWSKIAFGGNRFIVIYPGPTWSPGGEYASNSTTNGDTWSAAYSVPVKNCVYDGTKFVGFSGRFSYTSTDGVTWSSANTITTNTFFVAYDIAYGNGTFVVCGFDSAGGFSAFYSTNGTSWTQGTGTGQLWEKVAYGNGYFVMCNNSQQCRYSTNGVTWSNGGSTGITSIEDLTFGNGIFIALQTGTSFFKYSSNNGLSWSTADITAQINEYVRAIVYGEL